MGEQWLMNIVQVSVTAGGAVLLLLGLRALAHRRYSARMLCILWALLALRLMLPVQLTWPESALRVEAATNYVHYQVETAAEGVAAPSQAAWLSSGELAKAEEVPVAVLPVGSVLFGMWAIVAMLLGGLQIHAYRKFGRAVQRSSQVVTDGGLLAILAEEKTRLGIRRPVALLQSAAVSGPLLMGLVRPKLLLPVTGVAPLAARLIFRHELTHAKRHDLWLKLLLCAARVLHWFNPAVYGMVRAAGEDIELACDSAVAKGMDARERGQYSACILSTAANSITARNGLTTCLTSGKKGLKMRLEDLSAQPVKKRGVFLLTVVLGCMLVLGGCFALGEAQTDAQHYQNERYGFTLDIPKDIWQGLFRIEAVENRLSGPDTRLAAIGFDYSVLAAQENAGKTPEGFDAGGLLFAVELYPAVVGDTLQAENRVYLDTDERYAYYFWRAQPDGVEGSFDELIEQFAQDIESAAQSFAPGDWTKTVQTELLSEAANKWGQAMLDRDGRALLALMAGDTEKQRAQKLAEFLAVDTVQEGIGQSSPWIERYALQAVDADSQTATLIYHWQAAGSAGWRSAWQLHFTADETPKVDSLEALVADTAMGQVDSLAQFVLLYANDLGLPDGLVLLENEQALLRFDPHDAQAVAENILHLSGGQWVGQTPYQAGLQEAGVELTYRFGGGETLRLVMVEQFGQGYLPQDWYFDDGSNGRTMQDLASQWARGLAHKSGQFRYPLLNKAEQAKFVQARLEQNSDENGHWGWKIGGSSPSVSRWLVEPGETADTMRVVYALWDSSPHEYRLEEVLTFGRDAAGRLVITDSTLGYDYVPHLSEVASLDDFLALYDNELGLPEYSEEQLAYLQREAETFQPQWWYNLRGGTLGEATEEDGVRYMPYYFADGSAVVLHLQMVRPEASLAPLWITVGWHVTE